MSNDNKRKPAQAVASDPKETDQILDPPERIDATVDEVLDKLFNTTPEQIIEHENKHEQKAKQRGER